MQFHILYCRPCGYRDRADEEVERLARIVAVDGALVLGGDVRH